MRLTITRTLLCLSCWMNMLILSSNLTAQDILPDAPKLDLRRVEETWRILDKYAEQVGTGWNGYAEVPIRIDYPNGLSLHINDPKPPQNFKLVDGVTVQGKRVYLDDSRLNSLAISPRLDFAGGGAGLGTGHPTLRVQRSLITKEREVLADSLVNVLGHGLWPAAIAYSTDNTIFALTHELFHCFTDFAAMYWTGDKLYEPDLEYAVFAEIEGDLLEEAAVEADTVKVRKYLEESLVASEMKRHSMTERQFNYESDREKCEGTAEYAAQRIVQLVSKGYEPGLSQKDDPMYFGFRYSDYFPAMRLADYREVRRNTLEAGGKCYGNGFFKCLILDKLRPNWQKEFFRNKESFDQLITQIVRPNEQNKSALLERMKQDFNYEELVQRHSPVIALRDSTVRSFQESGGRLFIINVKAMGLTPKIISTGKSFLHDLQIYYMPGVTHLQAGDVSFNSKAIPVCYDIRNSSIKMKGSGIQNDEQDFDLKFDRQDTDGYYYDVTLNTQAFSLSAVKVKVVKSPTQIEILVLPAVQ